MKAPISQKSKENLLKDIKSGRYSKKELCVKYQYESLNSFNSTLYWWKTKGILNGAESFKKDEENLPVKVKRTRRANRISKDKKLEIIKDYNSETYTNEELAKKYGFPSNNAVSKIIMRLKNNKKFENLFKKDTETTFLDIKDAVRTVQTRVIKFPDGFSIHIEKSFVNSLVIHENGNISIIK